MLKDALAEMSGEEVSKIQDLLDTLRTEFKKENDNGRTIMGYHSTSDKKNSAFFYYFFSKFMMLEEKKL